MPRSFLLVARQDLAAALVIVPQILAFATQLVQTVTTDAQQRCALYPESGFFAAVYGKRLGQAAGMERFAENVLRRVTFKTPPSLAHIATGRASACRLLSSPACGRVSPADRHGNGQGGRRYSGITIDSVMQSVQTKRALLQLGGLSQALGKRRHSTARLPGRWHSG